MAEIFQILNPFFRKPGHDCLRVWLEPGYPYMVLPGVLVELKLDTTERGRRVPRLLEACSQQTMHNTGAHYRYWLLERAWRLDPHGDPERLLLEITYDRLPLYRVSRTTTH